MHRKRIGIPVGLCLMAVVTLFIRGHFFAIDKFRSGITRNARFAATNGPSGIHVSFGNLNFHESIFSYVVRSDSIGQTMSIDSRSDSPDDHYIDLDSINEEENHWGLLIRTWEDGVTPRFDRANPTHNRHLIAFQFIGGTNWKMAIIPHWFPTVILSLLFTWFLIARRRHLKRLRHGCCTKCGYDLRGNPDCDCCPECGHAGKSGPGPV